MRTTTAPPTHPQFIRDSPAGALAGFLSGWRNEPMDRCAAAAMLTFSLWQNAALPITATAPSAILLHAGNVGQDPIDKFVDDFVFEHGLHEKNRSEAITAGSQQADDYFIKGMHLAVTCARQVGLGKPNARLSIEQFHKSRIAYCGPGPGLPYSKARLNSLGWLSGMDNRCVLRLFGPADHESLREHILNKADCIRNPTGLGAQDLQVVPKALALSGSLNPGNWDEAIASGLIETGWPIVFLPHAAILKPAVPSVCKFFLASRWATSAQSKTWVTSDGSTCGDEWMAQYHRLLVERLRFMPPDHAFHVQRVVRELPMVCARIVLRVHGGSGTDDVALILANDLHRLTLRSILLGAASLAYHAWGFDTARPRAEVAALLHHLRINGPTSRRDLQRKFPKLGAADRDVLIERLVSEGLVTCIDNQVLALPLADFFKVLDKKTEHPMPSTFSHILAGGTQGEGSLPTARE